ncbi:MAG TPA: tetratricopeptide repeat protein [Kofleriaceae bacterium]|nr:tetratricopeptide repeat protein [Kofleriaceae bacterium]
MRSVVVLALVVGSYGVALAEDDPDKADKVFAEAQQLKDAGNTAEACKKFDEALSYNRNAVGTLLNVALCNEEAGKYATAVKYYTQARDLAREHNLAEHRKAAEDKLALTSPLVSHLAIAFAEKANEMKLVIDDEVVPLDKTDDIVIDPGSHHVVVTAPDRVPWETTVVVDKSSAKALAVPKLGYPVTVKKGRRTAAMIFGAAGGAMMLSGVALGLVARSKYNGQVGPGKACTDESPPRCDSEGYRITNDARTYGNFGTYIGIAGIAVTGVGAYLWFFGPKTSERNVAVVPTLAPESAGITAVGRF